jgi:hypothetical protein
MGVSCILFILILMILHLFLCIMDVKCESCTLNFKVFTSVFQDKWCEIFKKEEILILGHS